VTHRSNYVAFLFLAGVVSGVASIALSLLIKEFGDGLFLPELASQALFSLTPGEFESEATETLGPLAKYSTFIGAIITNILIYGLSAIFLGRIFIKSGITGYFKKVVLSSSILYILLVSIAILLVTTIQARSGIQIIPFYVIMLSLIPSQIVFGLLFSSFSKKVVPVQKEHLTNNVIDDKSGLYYGRGEFIRLMIASIISLPVIFFGLNRLFSIQEDKEITKNLPNLIPKSVSIPHVFKDPKLASLLASEVTPTYLFYRIDINPVIPEVDVGSWNLKINGLVDNPISLSYEEIKTMPSIEEYVTLECISNKIGGDLIGTALWKGVRLKDILGKAILNSNVQYIVFRCSDGYDVGIPLAKGLMDETILAYEMNTTPLTSKHGFPLRAIVPGLYGMMNPKWITEIELVSGVYEGYWQRNGWTNLANYQTGSLIVIPGRAPIRQRFRGLDEISNNSINDGMPIAGIAFGGEQGISKVEVSTDGGSTWKTAQIKDPLSKYTWVLWTAGYVPPDAKNYKIIVRATDKTGKVQTSELTKPFPDGATGYHTITV
jgi:DMSO/TMAO reductase YedYZ molybdopterin-dependent catalytic subunit